MDRLLLAGTPEEVEAGWAEFLHEYSRLLLHVARSMGGDYDAAMDRYSFVLERLRADDFRRLRAYRRDGRGKFSTWLVTVARRLSIDFHRSRYGRSAGEDDAMPDPERIARRSLADLLGESPDFARLWPADAADPERTVRRTELREALHAETERLGDRDRLLLALRFENGLTAREIARVMGFESQFHVYRRIKKVLRRLRDALEARGFRDSRP